jgi:hypothetical protein
MGCFTFLALGNLQLDRANLRDRHYLRQRHRSEATHCNQNQQVTFVIFHIKQLER